MTVQRPVRELLKQILKHLLRISFLGATIAFGLSWRSASDANLILRQQQIVDQGKIATLGTTIVEKNVQIASLEATQHHLESEITQYRLQLLELNKDVTQYQLDLLKIEGNLEDSEMKSEELAKQVQQLQQRLQVLEAERRQLEATVQTLRDVLITSHAHRTEAEQQLKASQQQLSQLTTSNEQVVAALQMENYSLETVNGNLSQAARQQVDLNEQLQIEMAAVTFDGVISEAKRNECRNQRSRSKCIQKIEQTLNTTKNRQQVHLCAQLDGSPPDYLLKNGRSSNSHINNLQMIELDKGIVVLCDESVKVLQ